MNGHVLAVLLAFGPAAGGRAPDVAGPQPSAASPATDRASPSVKMYAHLKVPLFGKELEGTPVARVDGELITLGELNDALARTHMDARGEGGKKDVDAVVQRVVDLKLLVAEAREMGIGELEEVKKASDAAKESELREMLKRQAVEHVEPDRFEVELIFRETVREWKVGSVLFGKEEDARAFVQLVKGGTPFADAAAKAVEEKRATGGKSGYFGIKELAPQVAQALNGMAVGDVSDPVKVKEGFTVVVMEDMRYPENAAARATAEAASRERKEREELGQLFEDLRKKYAKVDERLFKSLDFHSVKRFEAYLKDKRPLVKIKDDKPITVADFAADLRKDYFHGLQTAVREKKINNKKVPRLEALIAKRLHAKEARVRGLHETPEYARLLRQREDALIFGLFLKRAVLPGIDVLEKEVRAHYDAHQAEFTFPRFFKLDSVAFPNAKRAEAALAKARSGTEFRWLKSNSDDQLPPEKRTAQMDGTMLVESGLPEPLAKALNGAKSGEFRLYQAGPEEWHVVAVVEEVPPRPQPYLDAREDIAKKVFDEKVNASLKDWAAKVRPEHEVEIYVTRIGE